MNHCPHCFQSRGPAAVRARGGGAPWPHFNGERAENGNYIESEEVAKRHGICGDPEQVWLMDGGKQTGGAAAFVGCRGGSCDGRFLGYCKTASEDTVETESLEKMDDAPTWMEIAV